MTQFLQFVLLGLAVGAAWVWSRRSGHNSDSAATASPLAVSTGTVEAKPVEPPDEMGNPVAKAEAGHQGNPIASPADPGNSATPASPNLQRVLPDAGDAVSERPAETSSVNLQPVGPAATGAFVCEQGPRTPPPIVVSNKTDARHEIPVHRRSTKIATTDGTRHVAPEGRRGGQTEADRGGNPVDQRERTCSGLQLRLVCFKDNYRMWQLAVELPEDVSSASVRVFQDSEELQPTRFDQNRWPLKRLNGIIEAVESQNEGRRWQLEIGCGDEYLLFKLLAESETEEGRRVNSPSRGDYLLIAAENWHISDCLGIEPRPEPNIRVEGHVAYRFTVRDGYHARLRLGPQGREQRTIQSRSACFTFANKPADAVFEKYQAPLFLRSPPIVRALNPISWPQVEKLVLLVAGEGHGNLKACFKPAPINNEVDLTEHLKTTNVGWYVVRLYDAHELLLDDGHYFAFSRLLRDIKVSGAPVLPGADGHSETRLEFEHDAETAVEAFFGEQELEALPIDGGTVFSVPPRCEQVHWQIGCTGESPLKCITRIERLWWAFGSDSIQPTETEWTDKPVVVRRGDFRASSDKVIWVRLPKPQWVENVRVGFSQNSARNYCPPASEREFVIPLREFESSEQHGRVGVSRLNCWLTYNATQTSVELARVEVVYKCKCCEQEFKNAVEMRSHAVEHWEILVSELTLDEMRLLLPELPIGSYKCPQCLRFVHSDDVENPTSAICWHIQHEYPGTQISFYVVSDVQEFREHIFPTLPKIHRCRCGQEFTNATMDRLAAHLQSCRSVSSLFTLT